MKNIYALFAPLVLFSFLISQPILAQEAGTMVTVAGGGEQEGEGIPATDLALNLPLGASVDAQGNVASFGKSDASPQGLTHWCVCLRVAHHIMNYLRAPRHDRPEKRFGIPAYNFVYTL